MKIGMAVAATLLGLAASPAGAQPRWVDEPAYLSGLPTRVIMRAVRAQGLTPVGRPLLRDDVYIVRAVDDAGQSRRVLVDARSGRIVRVARGGADDTPRAGGAPPDEDRTLSARPRIEGRGPPPRPRASLADEPDAAPPSAVPHRGLPPLRPRPAQPVEQPQSPDGAPPRTERSAARPVTPPVPRPRPADATASVSAQPGAATTAPAKARPLPRVVLPGGPLPKSERTAATAPGQRASKPAANDKPASPPAPVSATPATSSDIPPVQGLD